MIITIANQKGGVGKTDLTVNLASYVASMGKKVLLIDLDPQANATDYLTEKKVKLSTSDLLMDNTKFKNVITETRVPNLSIAPGTSKLYAAQIHLLNDVGMQFKLKRKLKELKGYDYVFIDTPPSLGTLTINALTASDSVIVPMNSSYFAADGMEKLRNTVDKIREELNPKLEIRGYVLTMFDKRNRLSSRMEKRLRQKFGDKVFSTHIPVNVDLVDAPGSHKPIMLHSARSRGAYAYSSLAKEFLGL